jgi:hypothetical protein
MPYPFNFGYPATYQQMQQQQTQQMIQVTCEAEVVNWPQAPGVTQWFTDRQRYIWIKTTDSSPMGGYRIERFIRDEPQKPEVPDYVSRAEFEAFKASLMSTEVKTGE